MFSLFKIQGDDADVEAGLVSPAQSSPVPAPQSAIASDDTLLDSLATLSTLNGISLLQHSARLEIISGLLASVLTRLPLAMREGVAESFRGRVEKLMSLSDDRPLPETYHSALLTEVNRYLNALR